MIRNIDLIFDIEFLMKDRLAKQWKRGGGVGGGVGELIKEGATQNESEWENEEREEGKRTV